MVLSKREISFYIYVTGFSIYCLTYMLFIWQPIIAFYQDTITEAMMLGSVLLIPVSHAISSATLMIAHKVYAYFNMTRMIGWMTLLYPVTVGVVWILKNV
jgi:hypothetical protein